MQSVQPDSHPIVNIHLSMYFSTVLMNVTLILASLSHACLLPAMPMSSITEGPALASCPVGRLSPNTDLYRLLPFLTSFGLCHLDLQQESICIVHVLRD